MQKSKGFTLVELVIVIVILGILAVTAAPKFLNLSSDAKISTVNGVKGALQSANAVLYSKAVLAGEHKKASGSVTVDGTAIALVNGYVAATKTEVDKVLDLEGGFTTVQGTANATLGVLASDVVIYSGTVAPDDDTPLAEACLFIYRAAANNTSKPTYTLKTDGC